MQLLEESAARWLATQPEPNLRIAREIISRRKTARRADRYDNGMIAGMRLALSYLSDRPGDISQTGAEGYIIDVENADDLVTRLAR